MSVIPDPVALRLGQAGSGLTLTGAAAGVPWAADVECLVALVPGPAGHWVVSLPRFIQVQAPDDYPGNAMRESADLHAAKAGLGVPGVNTG
jgi:hypothetical protein